MKQNQHFILFENKIKCKTHKQAERTVGLHAENIKKQRILHRKD